MFELRPLPGFEGLYSVSNDGRVWSEPKARGRRHDGRWLKAFPDSVGYPSVCLSNGDQHVRMRVHRAVALAWLPNPEGLPQVNHLNGIKSDCRSENLEWCTPGQNNAHAYRTGLKVKSARQLANASAAGRASRRLSFDQAREIRQLVKAGELGVEVARRFNVRPITVSEIVRGKTYLQP